MSDAPQTPAGAVCASCGKPLAAGAAFCRACGTRTEPPAAPDAAETQVIRPAAPAPPQPPQPARPPQAPPPPPPPPKRGSGRRVAILVALAGLLAAAVAAAVVLVFGGSDSEPSSAPEPGAARTVPDTVQTAPSRSGEASSAPGQPPAAGGGEGAPLPPGAPLEPGRYIQAGSFRTVPGAESERDRLEAAGADVAVVSSDLAQELYPGFRVLLAGPFFDRGSVRSELRLLRRNGVPSAFARQLTPARTIGGHGAIVGEWQGTLERSGSERPGLNGPLIVSLEGAAAGGLVFVDLPGAGCEVELPLYGESALALTYGPAASCVGNGRWQLRPSGEELAVTLLPPGTDTIVVGKLQRR